MGTATACAAPSGCTVHSMGGAGAKGRDPTLDVRPGNGIGPVDIGMTRDEARAAAATSKLGVHDFRRAEADKREDGPPDLYIGGQLFAYFSGGDRVVEVEVAVSGPLPVTCLDLDLRAPFADVLEAMAEHGRVDRTHAEFPSTSAYPQLGVVFWADLKPADLAIEPVEAILVRGLDAGRTIDR